VSQQWAKIIDHQSAGRKSRRVLVGNAETEEQRVAQVDSYGWLSIGVVRAFTHWRDLPPGPKP